MEQVPDLVVPVREGAVNEQLRYALRSWAAHLPHRHVWLIGHRPQWAVNVKHIPTRQVGTKYVNTTVAMRAACEHPDVSDPFLWCNDDMFVMHTVDTMPVLHRGPVREVEAYYEARTSGAYLRGMYQTRALLETLGHDDPLSYELHVPMPVGKKGMLDALAAGRHLPVLHKRTLYGNLAELGGSEVRDVKILHRRPQGYDEASVWLSTMPDSFTNGSVGMFIRRSFRGACRYERGGR
ncbi:hypothetical protein B0E38_01837 [Streptomyces sp. 111WW2]|uniref:hypothetical protein n=1 Tax=Streptomyces sp. 111WW2 TaxID=1945515 RepID=UPI000D0C7EDD|nr:hypothetical protein [Streptomyces sp. 111WW2]PSK57992.1 hypothetical protein B0E38_01837 [Streptomyces sp. 111WW2]